MRPEDCDYAAYYCEENVWRLAGHPALEKRICHAVFISNPDRTCALWQQRACTQDGAPVVWDYHVILVAQRTSGNEHEVLDLDSTAGFPLPADAYLEATFPYGSLLPANLQPRFRMIPATEFRMSFASDRSHMRQETKEGVSWIQKPPPWPIIQTQTQTMNLEIFINMGDGGPGIVVDLPGFYRRLTASAV